MQPAGVSGTCGVTSSTLARMLLRCICDTTSDILAFEGSMGLRKALRVPHCMIDRVTSQKHVCQALRKNR
jgi:hypothetical protein